MTRIAIVGAGISGLTCAWYLQRLLPDATIELLESSDRVGGVIETVEHAPYLAELGADNIATLIPEVNTFLADLGVQGEFIHPNTEHRFAQVVFQGSAIPIPNGFSLMQPTQMAPILWSPLLSWKGKLRLLAEYFIRSSQSEADESVESFAVRRLGRECFDRLVEPIVGGIFTARAETLSMKATMHQFRTMEREAGGLIRGALKKRKSESKQDVSARKANGARYDQFVAPKQGMGWWLNTIRDQLKSPPRYGTKIDTVQRSDSGKWKLTGETLRNGTEEYDAVCLAVPGWVAADLLLNAAPSIASHLDRIPYASSAVAIFSIPKSEIKSSAMSFGIVVPKIENRECLAISLTSEKYPGRAPRDHVLVRVFMGGAIRPELLEQSDDALLQIAFKEVKSLLGAQSLPRWQKLVRWNHAMPQYMVGHCERIEHIRRELRHFPGLHLIGNAYDGVGIPQCIRLAKETAIRIDALLKSTDETVPY